MQLIESFWELTVPEGKVHSGKGSRQLEQEARDHISTASMKQKEWTATGERLWIPKAVPSDVFPLARLHTFKCSITPPLHKKTQHHHLEIKCPNTWLWPMSDISHSNHHNGQQWDSLGTQVTSQMRPWALGGVAARSKRMSGQVWVGIPVSRDEQCGPVWVSVSLWASVSSSTEEIEKAHSCWES